MRVCSESRPPKRRTKYSPRQPMIPQSSPLPRRITRAIRFGNEAGRVSMRQLHRGGGQGNIQAYSRKKVHAKRSFGRLSAGKLGRKYSQETTLAQLDRIRANS